MIKPIYAQFVKAYLENGNNATQAYLKIRPNCKRTTAGVNACKLLKDANVQALINRLNTRMVASIAINRDTLTTEAEEIRLRALESGAYQPALNAVEMKGRLHQVFETEVQGSVVYQTFIQALIGVPVKSGVDKSGGRPAGDIVAQLCNKGVSGDPDGD